ncbi:hypothetical protein [Polaribacter porphyrae]|uniref:Uncharacterized protein n=1 Tax=Polaribacter porphyrae TaxID=1137780 RepID=A0A2S7WJD2_9FLAO|nr:hypothetical protein [Polaribacter porphyrae]PQJ77718.1 hypothetical protein BTO18_00310 [Polaribacter porphyrae]
MINFAIQLVISIFIGGCFVFLAKKYRKNLITYFCIGFFICLAIRILYLLIYGLITDFSINQNFDNHRNLSVLFSIMISYVFFRILKAKLHKENPNHFDINDIGKE